MRDTDSQNFGQATQNLQKRVVEGVDLEVLRALEQKSVWNIDGLPDDANNLQTDWCTEQKRTRTVILSHLRPVFGPLEIEQVFIRYYSIIFVEIVDMSIVKLILLVARKWRMPATHVNVPTAYVKFEKESNLSI